jgi:hypothetical protein
MSSITFGGDQKSGGMEVYLDHDQKVTYMKIVGKIGYISTTLRHDVRYGYLIISRRLSRHKKMGNALGCLDHGVPHWQKMFL